MPKHKKQQPRPLRLIVLRTSSEEVTFADVRAELTPAALDKDLADERSFLAALQEAVTDWVRTTEEGREWYENTSHDANVGDLCAYGIPEQVAKALTTQGIESLTVECTSTADRHVCRDWAYDTHLVDEDAL
jgi:hypothetical protein